MSIAGILDAMRADIPLAQRVVWQCLENHANGHRSWAISVDEIARELHLAASTIVAAVKALGEAGIIRAERRRRNTTIYHMLRNYPVASDPPSEMNDVQDNSMMNDVQNRRECDEIAPESLYAENANSRPFLYSENANSRPFLYSENANSRPLFDAENANSRPLFDAENANSRPFLNAENPHVEESNRKKERKEGRKEDSPPIPPMGGCGIDVVVRAWNSVAQTNDLPLVRSVTEARTKHVRNRVKEHGVHTVLAVVAMVGQSAFLCGKRTSFHATFDWVMGPTNFAKVLDGNYAKDRESRSRPLTPAQERETKFQAMRDQIAALRRREQEQEIVV